MSKRKNKKKLTGVQSLVVGVVVVGVLAYNAGYLDVLKPSIEGSNSSVVLSEGQIVVPTEEIKSCGYDNYTWSGYKVEEVDKASCLLDTLKVNNKNENSPKYQREEHFGTAWDYDYNNSNCDTRNDILKESLTMADTKGCTVYRGVYGYDPYTGDLDVVWDKSHAASLQVDHMVALKNAWISGANRFSADDAVQKGIASEPFERREQIANDPLNLILADGPENQSKSAKDARDWLVPENPEFRCEYSIRQIMVKSKYSLTITTGEKKALNKQLGVCK